MFVSFSFLRLNVSNNFGKVKGIGGVLGAKIPFP
jgi:hypothetical protein